MKAEIMSNDFPNDEQIQELLSKARKIRDVEIDVDELIELNLSRIVLRRKARKYYRSQRVISLYVLAAERRAKLHLDQLRQREEEIRKIILQAAKNVYLFSGDEDDGGSMLGYILSWGVFYASMMIDIDNEKIMRAFSQKQIYFEIYGMRADNVSLEHPDVWTRLVEKYAGGAEEV